LDKYLDLFGDKKVFANIATLMPDGSPQVTPVWFDFKNGHVRVNTALGRMKARNMKVGSKVAIAIMDPDNPYRYVQVRRPVVSETEQGRRRPHRFASQEILRAG
jgi:PPOX class probable F420-dependent enzyme